MLCVHYHNTWRHQISSMMTKGEGLPPIKSYDPSWQRIPNPSVSWTHLICLTSFFKFCSNSTTTTIFFALFPWLTAWLCHLWCVILLNDIMDLHMWSLGVMVPEGQIAQRHTACIGANRLGNPYKHKVTQPATCSQQLSVLRWLNN